MHTLIVCYGLFLGGCMQILQLEFPTLKACEYERAAVFAQPRKPEWAVCRPGKRD